MNSVKYRPEIDGLRAFAVLSVILFHAGFPYLKGGFVGVDIFFVISGYLITTIILSELNDGVFTIIGFYERRVRRILPALFFILTFSIILAYFLLSPDDLIRFSKSAIASVLFTANYFFAFSTSYYFAPNIETEPLLHFWSLGVEEQFYLFFPILTIILWRFHQRERERISPLFLFVLIILVCLSFAWANYFSYYPHIFYDTASRGFELLIGSLTAVYTLRFGAPLNKTISQILSAIGFLFVIFAVLYLSNEFIIPSFWSFIPTIGAALIILFANRQTLTGRLFSAKPIVFIGLLSYSLYLWHWVLFAFAKLIFGELKLYITLALIALTFFLSYISWRFVEKPFRNKNLLSRKQVFIFALCAALSLITIASVFIATKGVLNRFSDEERDLLTSSQFRALYVAKKETELRGTAFIQDERKRVFIIGDSYSQDFINMLYEGELLSNSQIISRYVSATCQVYIDKEDWRKFLEPKEIKTCEYIFNRADNPEIASLAKSADLIIIASNWKEWAAKRLPQTIENLRITPKAQIIVIGAKQFGTINARSYIGFSVEEKRSIKNTIDVDFIKLNEMMKEEFSDQNILFIDLLTLICGKNAKSCPVFTPEGKLISYDGGHLTQAGAKYIGETLKDHSVFVKLRENGY
ncbi:MAG: acyltransferase [Helicobacteraceae bacterium]|jgi:peptidoglycan/LPS O-acetylase OafA/YrhL|nr:acyltransferase [Helicobacteraceae bacterium]